MKNFLYPLQQGRDDIGSVSANVSVYNDRSEKRRQRYQRHVHAEVRPWNKYK